MTRSTYWQLATLILLIAAGLRVWQLHTYPPGPHYDEAANVLITRSIAFGGANYFPIVNSYQGREALYYYLNAPLFHLIGDTEFTLQISNVFMNLMTIAATIALGRAMFSGKRGVIIGLVAGALMALSIPMVLLSRQAFRAPTLPLMQALALLCLWRGLNKGHRWLVAGGFFGGAALYTYMASRLFPLWLLLGGLLLVALDVGNRWRRLRQGVIFFGVFGLTALPMAIFAVQHPDIFLGRLGEVTQAEQSITLGESIERHLRMFFIEGERLLRYNLPGRPYFTLPEGLLLLTGLAVSVWQVLRGQSAAERAAYGLALLSPLMIIPSVISVGGFPPNHMRSIGMVPLVFILAGIGAAAVARQLPAVRPAVGRAVVIVLLVLAAVPVASAYFNWATRADLYYDTDADLAAAAQWLSQNVADDTRLYIAARDREHPTVVIANLHNITWLGTDTLFRPPPGEEGIVIFPRSAPPPEGWAGWLAPYAIPAIPLAPDDRPAFEAYRLSGETPLPDATAPPQPLRNSTLSLIGLRGSPIFPGAEGAVTVQWRVDQPPPAGDMTPLLQVEDAIGTVIHREELPLRGTEDWREGETVMVRIGIEIPKGTPPGMYPLRMTWVARSSDQYLPYIDREGALTGVWATVGYVEVLRPVSLPSADELGINAANPVDLADGVRLLAWDYFADTKVRPGEYLDLRLVWQGQGDERQNIVYDAVLMAEAGGERVLWQGVPLEERYPPQSWRDGEIAIEYVRWYVPRQQPAGNYTLAVRHESVTAALAPVEVEEIMRTFTAPAVDHPLQIVLGDTLQLYGYSLSAEGDLTLVWQALDTVDVDYTVFVHVLDEAGNIVAQRDMMPDSNRYPTSLWRRGEFVTDTHPFPALPPAPYQLRIGLYDQSTGTRLNTDNGVDFILVDAMN